MPEFDDFTAGQRALSQAFVAELWAGYPEQAHALSLPSLEDPAAYDEIASAAWLDKDMGTALAADRVAMQSGSLSRGHALRMARRQVDTGRFAQALSLLLTSQFPPNDNSQYHYTLARALAGAGRLHEAAETARIAAELAGANEAIATFARTVKDLVELESSAVRPTDWPTCARLIDGYITVGLNDRAVLALQLFLADGVVGSDPENLSLQLRTSTILHLIDPNSVSDLLTSLRRQYDERGWLPEWRGVLNLIGGSQAELPRFDYIGRGRYSKYYRLYLALGCVAAGKWEEAIVRLGPIVSLPAPDELSGLDLARSVGRMVIEKSRPRFRQEKGRKIVDVFPVFDELLMLKLKLGEMYDWVDRFVIIEATKTFTGRPKPLYFSDAKESFSAYADKILHIVVDFPDYVDTAWAREFYQRDCALPILSEICSNDDLILITDADEILDRKAIENFDGHYANLKLKTYDYFFNLRRIRRPTSIYGAILRAKFLTNIGPALARIAFRKYCRKDVIENAGWHFSSVKDANGLESKCSSYSHTEHGDLDAVHFADMLSLVRSGGRLPGYERCEIDDSFPGVVRRQRQELAPFIL